MFVPFYSFLYLIGNLERAGRPFAIRFFGGLIIASAAIAWIAGIATDPDNFDDHDAHPGMVEEFDPDDDDF
jgi:hypothetical protein